MAVSYSPCIQRSSSKEEGRRTEINDDRKHRPTNRDPE
jgi:hypothetical protein